MNRNVEIKARVRDPAAFAGRAAALAGDPPRVLRQHDVFFAVPSGRLKLRRQDGGAELIAYARPDGTGPRTSRYVLYRTGDPDALQAALAAALPVLGEVRKVRRLFLVGRTRIHLDEVAGLGWFMELEVMLAPGETPAAGAAEARRLAAALGIVAGDEVTGAYLDLLRAGKAMP